MLSLLLVDNSKRGSILNKISTKYGDILAESTWQKLCVCATEHDPKWTNIGGGISMFAAAQENLSAQDGTIPPLKRLEFYRCSFKR